MAPAYLLGKYLDGDFDSPYPRYDIEDVCWLSITDRHITLHNRKGQPVAKCDTTLEMSDWKKEDYGTEEKTLKRKNIITLKLTDIELELLQEAAEITGFSRSLAVENEIHQCIADLFQLRKEVLKLAGGKNGNRKTH